MRLRAGLLAATVVAALAPAGLTLPPAAAAVSTPLSDPPASQAPSGSFIAACTGTDGTQSALLACMSDAIPDYNQARAAEGLTPLVLPNDFAQLSAPEQLLALTNIERVDRGLVAVPALSSRLNALAQAGANAGQDPAFPSPLDGTSAGSNWFAGDSPLLAVFTWMYDDGPDSPNGDCGVAGASGCWGHRHAILGTEPGGTVGYDAPVAMGAALGNGSLTEELVGDDTTDTPDGTPTWDQIVETSTFGLDKTNAQVEIEPGSQGSLTVIATSSAVEGTLTAEITHGAPQWSVTPASCDVEPGDSCTFTVTFSPTRAGSFPGILGVSNGLTLKTVALAGVGLAPHLVMDLGRLSLRHGSTLTVFGSARDATTGAAMGGVPITLQSRSNGAQPWHKVALARTGPGGRVTFRLQPTASAAYRLVVLDTSGKVETTSGTERAHVF